MSFKKTICALTAATMIGLSGCASLNTEKPRRNITELIPEKYIEARVIDTNKDGYFDMAYLTKSKSGYGLKIIKGNNDGSFTNPALIRNYGNMDPRTRNFLVFFYHDISKVIENKVK